MKVEPFKPAWWLPSPHAQTLWPNLWRKVDTEYRRQRLELPDGDFIDLDWGGAVEGPIIVLFHGLEGSSRSAYARGLTRYLGQAGYQVIVSHARGCSGEPNRLRRRYHAGDTGDIATVCQWLADQYPQHTRFAVGVSLGGNALLKYLAEQGDAAPLRAAVAISVPFELSACADRLRQGTSRIYLRALMQRMRRAVLAKHHHDAMGLDIDKILAAKDFWEFDNLYTAPLHGFRDVHDYYSQASCRQYLGAIQTPTLILHAEDDPFLNADVIPKPSELSHSAHLALQNKGGHVGFVYGRPGRPRFWLEESCRQYFDTALV